MLQLFFVWFFVTYWLDFIKHIILLRYTVIIVIGQFGNLKRTKRFIIIYYQSLLINTHIQFTSHLISCLKTVMEPTKESSMNKLMNAKQIHQKIIFAVQCMQVPSLFLKQDKTLNITIKKNNPAKLNKWNDYHKYSSKSLLSSIYLKIC